MDEAFALYSGPHRGGFVCTSVYPLPGGSLATFRKQNVKCPEGVTGGLGIDRDIKNCCFGFYNIYYVKKGYCVFLEFCTQLDGVKFRKIVYYKCSGFSNVIFRENVTMCLLKATGENIWLEF